MSLYVILTNINMAVLSATAKLPNLNHRQYFWIYSTLNVAFGEVYERTVKIGLVTTLVSTTSVNTYI